MVKDAEAHASEDKKARETIEAKNNAESLVYSTEKALKDYGDKISSQEKEKIESAIKDLKDSLAKSDVSAEELKSKTESLQQASMELGQKVYENAQQQAQQAQSQAGSSAESNASSANAANNSSNDDGTVDADFEEVK